MPEKVAVLEVGLTLLTKPFLKSLGGALDQGARLVTQWGVKMTALVSAPLTLMGKGMVQMASDVDKAVYQVVALLKINADAANDTAFSMEAAYQEVLNVGLALSTEFGSTVQDVVSGMFFVIGSGFDTITEAETIMEAATKAAVAGFTTTAVAVDVLVGVLNSYGLGAEYAAYVSNVLFQVVNKGKITFEELSRFIGRTTPLASLLGVSLEELGAIIAQVTVQGEWARRAITSLDYVLRSFLVPSEEAKELFALALHMEETELAAAELRRRIAEPGGLLNVFKLLHEELGASPEIWAKMFMSAQAMRMVAGLLQDEFKGTNEMLEWMERAQEGAGAATEVFQVQAESFSFALSIMKAKLDAIRISFGYDLIKAIMPAVDAVTSFAEAFRKMPPEFRKLVVQIGLVAVALGPLLLLLGQFLSVGSLVIGTVLNPMAWAFAALALAIHEFVRANYEVTDVFSAIAAAADIAARAFEWGAEAIHQFAAGMIDAVGYVIRAVVIMADAIAWLLAPGSEPRALQGITSWGRRVMEMYLEGMTDVDVGILRKVASQIGDILGMKDVGWEQTRDAYGLLAEIVDKYQETGEFSEELWSKLGSIIGAGADQLREWMQLQLEMLRITDRMAAADEAYAEEKDRLLERQLVIRKQIEEIDRRIRDLRREQSEWERETAEIPERFKAAYRRTFAMRMEEMQIVRDTAQDRAAAVADEISAAERAHKIQMDELQAEKELIADRIATYDLLLAWEKELARLRQQQADAAERAAKAAKEEEMSLGELVERLKEGGEVTLDWEERIGALAAKSGELAKSLEKWELFWRGVKGIGFIHDEFEQLSEAEQKAYEDGWKVHESFEAMKKSGRELSDLLGAIGVGFLAGLRDEPLEPLPLGTREDVLFAQQNARAFGAALREMGDALGGVVTAFGKWWETLTPEAQSVLLVLLGLQVVTGIPGAVIMGIVGLAFSLAKAYIAARLLAGALGGAAAGAAGIGLLGKLQVLWAFVSTFVAAGGIPLLITVMASWAVVLGAVATMAGLAFVGFEKMDELLDRFAPKVLTQRDDWDKLKDSIMRVAVSLLPGGKGLYDGYVAIRDLIPSVKEKLEELGVAFGDSEEEADSWETGMSEDAEEVYDNYLSLYMKMWGGSVLKDLMGAFNTAFADIREQLKLTGKAVTGFVVSIGTSLKNIPIDMWNLGRKIGWDFVSGLESASWRIGGWLGRMVGHFSWLAGQIADKVNWAVNYAAQKFNWLSNYLWRWSVVPDMVSGIIGEFERLRTEGLGEWDALVGGVAQMPIAPAYAGGQWGAVTPAPTIQAIFVHNWDASLAGKDRAELLSEAEAGAFQALTTLFGESAVQISRGWGPHGGG